MTKNRPQKHPCPDCFFCQWCAEERCNACRGVACTATKPQKNGNGCITKQAPVGENKKNDTGHHGGNEESSDLGMV
jgi:hypothetical protein